MSWHIYPIIDESEHETEGTMCWCDPEFNSEDGNIFIIRNAMDCRELIEEAEEIINRE